MHTPKRNQGMLTNALGVAVQILKLALCLALLPAWVLYRVCKARKAHTQEHN